MPEAIGKSVRVEAVLKELKTPVRNIPVIRRHPFDEPSGNKSPATPTAELFACNVYTLDVMDKTLPKPIFAKLTKKMSGAEALDKETADAVAHAVKVWAMERGATHFTHWFQPQTNRTAEKHDSFLTLRYDVSFNNLKVHAFDSFSGSQLMQAEPDASSFPHGGMRTIFEARGYTVWDTTSPMFLQDGPHDTRILYIPSVFISYTGEALDEKTVLLRSCQAVNKAAVELCNLLGHSKINRILVTLGTEQEFFLVDRAKYALRPDIRLTGRSLFGLPPTKHQQLEDHYFGRIPSRVLSAMSEAEFELWKLGVPIKTRHNEVAPGQFEMAPIFEEASVAVDHNHLTMDVLSRVAHRHGLKALFHEKPFKGINGSGKHCNWSMSTDTGINLLEPGSAPEKNTLFMAVLTSILIGLDRHGGLLSASIASASNEHRLGAHEAPPAIISAFLGDQLDDVLNSFVEERSPSRRASATYKKVNLGSTKLDLKVAHLPEIQRDLTDRNRTSPFAFTGNKFEFRAVGSSQSPSFPTAMLNSICAAGMNELLAALKQKPSLDEQSVHEVLKEFIKQTRRVRFEGNNYSEEWVKEAEQRGLLNSKHAPQSFAELVTPANKKALVDELGVLSESELKSRYHVLNEKYTQLLLIEAKTLRNLCVQNISPALLKYTKDTIASLDIIATRSNGQIDNLESRAVPKLINDSNELAKAIDELEKAISQVEDIEDALEAASTAAATLKVSLPKVRKIVDSIEEQIADDAYPFPKYRELLF